ncbi:hypothetical protein [Lysobacter enzymogenes]|uniref:hypothetical protein n=1 Tax=Lysobacter enzymogenes TaxID=69 RepID=UPI00099DD56B|nr:hypothetical protein [Lysobacter enzymogenes]UZW62856.1 hypothetical protein BV903_011395 [Lysobacter enzymogenes]
MDVQIYAPKLYGRFITSVFSQAPVNAAARVYGADGFVFALDAMAAFFPLFRLVCSFKITLSSRAVVDPPVQKSGVTIGVF